MTSPTSPAGSSQSQHSASPSSSSFPAVIKPQPLVDHPPAAASPSSSATSLPPSPSLLSALVAQLDFYFSPSNLSSDAFLLSQMDAERFVPIATIAGFRKICQLSTDLPTVRQAMSLCANLQLDPTHSRVRPTHRPPAARTVLLLRDIPQEVAEEEVAALFALDGCPATPVTLRREGVELWSAELAGEEEDGRETALWLTNQTLRGRLIKCRLQTEPQRQHPQSTSALPALSDYSGGQLYGYHLDPYAAQSVSAYQQMGHMPPEQLGMLYAGGGGGGYVPYGQGVDPYSYRGVGYSSNDTIDIHIPLPYPHKPYSATHAGKKGRPTATAPPAPGGVAAAPGAGEAVGSVQAAGEAPAPGAGKKKKGKKKKAAAAAALAAASASSSAPLAPLTDQSAASAITRLAPVISSFVASSSSSASIPLIAPSSYAITDHRPTAPSPATITPTISSPSTFPPISATAQPAASTTSAPAASSTPVTTPPLSPAAKPPVLLNYASHVGSLSAAEVARVAAAAKAMRDAKHQRPDKGEKGEAQEKAVRDENKEDDPSAAPPSADSERGRESTAEATHTALRPLREGGQWVRKEGELSGLSASPSWRERHREYRKVIHAPHPQRYQPRLLTGGASSPSPTSSTSASSAHSTASSSSSSPSSPSSSSSSSAPPSSSAVDSAPVKRPFSYAELIKRTASASPASGKQASHATPPVASAPSAASAAAPPSPGARSGASLRPAALNSVSTAHAPLLAAEPYPST